MISLFQWQLSFLNLLSIEALLERFSIEHRKTKTNAITMANHNKRKQHNGPVRTWSKYMWPAPSAGNWRVHASRNWFWFSIWLVEQVEQIFLNQSQGIIKLNQSNSGLLLTLNWNPLYFVITILRLSTANLIKIAPVSFAVIIWVVTQSLGRHCMTTQRTAAMETAEV